MTDKSDFTWVPVSLGIEELIDSKLKKLESELIKNTNNKIKINEIINHIKIQGKNELLEVPFDKGSLDFKKPFKTTDPQGQQIEISKALGSNRIFRPIYSYYDKDEAPDNGVSIVAVTHNDLTDDFINSFMSKCNNSYSEYVNFKAIRAIKPNSRSPEKIEIKDVASPEFIRLLDMDEAEVFHNEEDRDNVITGYGKLSGHSSMIVSIYLGYFSFNDNKFDFKKYGKDSRVVYILQEKDLFKRKFEITIKPITEDKDGETVISDYEVEKVEVSDLETSESIRTIDFKDPSHDNDFKVGKEYKSRILHVPFNVYRPTYLRYKNENIKTLDFELSQKLNYSSDTSDSFIPLGGISTITTGFYDRGVLINGLYHSSVNRLSTELQKESELKIDLPVNYEILKKGNTYIEFTLTCDMNLLGVYFDYKNPENNKSSKIIKIFNIFDIDVDYPSLNSSDFIGDYSNISYQKSLSILIDNGLLDNKYFKNKKPRNIIAKTNFNYENDNKSKDFKVVIQFYGDHGDGGRYFNPFDDYPEFKMSNVEIIVDDYKNDYIHSKYTINHSTAEKAFLPEIKFLPSLTFYKISNFKIVDGIHKKAGFYYFR